MEDTHDFYILRLLAVEDQIGAGGEATQARQQFIATFTDAGALGNSPAVTLQPIDPALGRSGAVFRDVIVDLFQVLKCE